LPAGVLKVFILLRPRVQTDRRAQPASYPVGTRGSFPGGKRVHGVNVIPDLHLAPRLKMRGAIPPLPNTYS